MAGDWIKMSTDLRTHPKVVRISSALKADRFRVIGGLHAVWCLFDAHSVDGSLEGYSLEALDDLIGWPGFSAAMAAVEWINVSEQALDLPRFSHHNGQSAKRRAQETDRKRVSRMSAETSASDADTKRTREEKSREEEKKIDPPAAAPSPVKAKKVKTQLREDFAVSDAVKAWALKAGFDRLDEHLDAFKRKAAANGYAYVNWDAAFMEAIREDWAKLRTTRNGSPAPAGHTVPSQAADETARYLAERKEQEKQATLPPPALLAKVRGAVKTEAA